MESIAHKPVLAILTAAAALVAAAAVFLFLDYRAAAGRHQKALLERGEALADALTAGIRAQGRMARARGERIKVLYEEAAKIPGVLGARLTKEDGAVLIEASNAAYFPSPPPGSALWEEEFVTLAVPVELPPVEDPHANETQHGPRAMFPAAESLPAGAYVITLMLDATHVYDQIAREKARLAVSLSVVTCAVALGAGLLLLHLRRLALESDLAHAREIAAENQRLAQLGAGLAHETKNPLNVVRGLAQSIISSLEAPPDIHDNAARIVDEVDQTVGHINSFLTLSRPRAAALSPTSLTAFLEDVVSLVRPEAQEKGIIVEVASGGGVILADTDLLRRALLNLLINALRACQSGCHVRVETPANTEGISLCVTDDGCGIAPEDLPHVKEPYFSRFKGGTGLGLAIVEQIARAHGASLTLAPRGEGGTRVCLGAFRAVE